MRVVVSYVREPADSAAMEALDRLYDLVMRDLDAAPGQGYEQHMAMLLQTWLDLAGLVARSYGLPVEAA